MRSYTPTSSDDDKGHFDLLIKVCISSPLHCSLFRLLSCSMALQPLTRSRLFFLPARTTDTIVVSFSDVISADIPYWKHLKTCS